MTRLENEIDYDLPTAKIETLMKNLSILIVLFVLNCYQVSAEIVTVVTSGSQPVTNFIFQATSTAYTNTYSVATNVIQESIVGSVSIRAGETAKVLSYSSSSSTLSIQTGGYNAAGANSIPSAVFVGPGSISLSSYFLANNHNYMTMQITRNDEVFIPSGSVLVPADSSGPVSVILESSTNLVAWSSALPGTYGTTSQNQYFRVRAVRHTP